MIWLSWRQHRAQLLVVAGALAAAAVFWLLTGPAISSSFSQYGLTSCALTTSSCSTQAGRFLEAYQSLQLTVPLLLLWPIAIGVFWGAPLVAREYEAGTYLFAWAQSVPRARWLLTKTAVLMASALAVTGVLTIGVATRGRPFLRASDQRFALGYFDLVGIVPLGCVVFALALGIASGVWIRRTLPAMTATMVAFVAARAAVALLLRPALAAHRTIAYSLAAPSPRAGMGDWALRSATVDAAGRVIGPANSLDFNTLQPRCPDLTLQPTTEGLNAIQRCVDRLGLHVRDTYIPGDRFWTLQAIELGIFVGLAAILVWLTLRRLRLRAA